MCHRGPREGSRSSCMPAFGRKGGSIHSPARCDGLQLLSLARFRLDAVEATLLKVSGSQALLAHVVRGCPLRPSPRPRGPDFSFPSRPFPMVAWRLPSLFLPLPLTTLHHHTASMALAGDRRRTLASALASAGPTCKLVSQLGGPRFTAKVTRVLAREYNEQNVSAERPTRQRTDTFGLAPSQLASASAASARMTSRKSWYSAMWL